MMPLMATTFEYFNEVEGAVCVRVNRLSRRRGVRWFFSIVSRLGDGWFWLGAGGSLLFARGAVVLPDVLVLVAAAAAGIVIYKQLKHRLVRERPYINHRAISCGAAPLDRYSFPSGHTLHAVSFTILFHQLEPLLTMVTLPFAILVAASRVILGLHYPSDVIIGAVLGATLASIAMQML